MTSFRERSNKQSNITPFIPIKNIIPIQIYYENSKNSS